MADNPPFANLPGYDPDGFPVVSAGPGVPNLVYAGLPGYDDMGYPVRRFISSTPLFGEIVCNGPGGSRVFKFSANGSDERQKLADVYQYFADELAENRRVNALIGAGDYGFDGRGLTQQFAVGSTGLNISGMGPEVTRFGFVGDTQSGSDWSALEFEPETDPVKSVIGITQTGGTATANITSHGAVAGESVRVYSSDQDGYNGIHIVDSVVDTDNFTFAVPAATVTPATGTMTCAIHSEFLRDFAICNLQLIDTDPAAHSNVGVEETHGIAIKQAYGVRMQNIWSDSIGDESIELLQVEDFEISSFRSKSTPATELTGGGALSIKNGCHAGLVDKFIISNISEDSAHTFGVNLKSVVHPENITDIKIQNGFVVNPVLAALQINTGSSDIKRIDVDNINAVGGAHVLKDAGGSTGFCMEDLAFSRITGTRQTGRGFNINRVLSSVKTIRVNHSKLDGTFAGDNPAIFVNGNDIKFNEVSVSNSKIALYSTDSSNMVWQGGTLDSCGGSTSEFPVMRDRSSSGNMVVDNAKVLNSNADTMLFRGVHTIKNCPNLEAVANLSQGPATGFTHFYNNKKVIAKVLTVANDNSNASDNEFEPLSNPSVVGLINVTGDNCSVDRNRTTQTANPVVRLIDAQGCTACDNKAPLLTSGNGLEEKAATAADRNIITRNQLNGRPVTTIGASTIADDNL